MEVSEKLKSKVIKLKKATWQGIDKADPEKKSKTFGPKSDKQIAWEVKLPLDVVEGIKA